MLAYRRLFVRTIRRPASTISVAVYLCHRGSATPAPGAVEVSPGGVTTGVGAPAESTEEEYFQACHAAKAWMDQQGGERQRRSNPLKSFRHPKTAGPGTFNSPWAQLTPASRRASSWRSGRRQRRRLTSNHGCESG